MLYAIIMAGGTGSRLWPMSRRGMPKQCLALTGEDTLVQLAAQRVRGRIPPERTLVITNETQQGILRQQLPQLPPENIIAEPCGKGSAPCIGLAAILLRKTAPDATMLVLSADHVIRPADKFLSGVDTACRVATERERLVVFGVKPTSPSPEFGYIHRADKTSKDEPVYRVAQFTEKPDVETAREFVNTGEYYWNSGMFVWTVEAIMAAIKQHMPQLGEALEVMAEAIGTDKQEYIFAKRYDRLANQTIDYGVMERADNVEVVEADFDWDDVGTWPAVAKYHDSDAEGNTVIGEAELLDARNCLIRSESKHLIGVVGVDDLVIVHTSDATLVCHRDRAGEVRKLVDRVKTRDTGNWT